MPRYLRKPCLNHPIPPTGGPSCLRAFTLIELLVVIAIIAILAAMLFPVFGTAKAKGQETACRNNLKQIAAASLIYADDNGSKFMDNVPLAYEPSTSNNWALGNLTYPTQATNVVLLEQGELFPYTAEAALYRCPSDTTQSTASPHVRSYSMNCWIGGNYMTTGVGGASPETGYRTFIMENELAAVSASVLWLMADENPTTIDDPWWLVTMDNSKPFQSFPALWHQHGYNLSFVDGHVERWGLNDSRTVLPPPVSAQDTDWMLLKQHSTTQLGPL